MQKDISIICNKIINEEITYQEIDKKILYQIIAITGRPWRFVEGWGDPWKLKHTSNFKYPYAWVPRPGTQGAINYD